MTTLHPIAPTKFLRIMPSITTFDPIASTESIDIRPDAPGRVNYGSTLFVASAAAPATSAIVSNSNPPRIAALRAQIESSSAGEWTSGQLAARISQLNVQERNVLLKTLSTDGMSVLAAEVGLARWRNPAAYQQMICDLTAGQPPQEVQRLINGALLFNVAANPVGQNLATNVVNDIATHIAQHGTKAQKLGLIGLLTNARAGGAAARSAIAANAVGALFRGLNGDADAITRALSLMSQSDKQAVARESLKNDRPGDIERILRYTTLSTSMSQQAQMVEQFMKQLDSATGQRWEAAVSSITGVILKSPNKFLNALRREDQDFNGNGGALATYMANLLESAAPQSLQVMMTALKYGNDLGGARSNADLERIDYLRFNAPDRQNASTRGYFVGSFDQALARLEAQNKDVSALSRNAVAGGIDALKTVLNTVLPSGFKSYIDYGATGLKFLNAQFNSLSPLDATQVFDVLRSLGRPTVPGTSGTPILPESGNFFAYNHNVDASCRKR